MHCLFNFDLFKKKQEKKKKKKNQHQQSGNNLAFVRELEFTAVFSWVKHTR